LNQAVAFQFDVRFDFVAEVAGISFAPEHASPLFHRLIH
jgi:hypothetical protein